MADNPKAFSIITSDDTPILTGTYDSSDSNGFLTVTVGGVTYSLGTDAELTTSNNTWSLDLSTAPALAEGANSVAVAAQDAAGNPLSTGFTSTVTVDTSSSMPNNLVVHGDSTGTEGDGILTEADIANAYLAANADAFSTIQADLQLLSLAGPGFNPFTTVYSDENGNWSLVLSELGQLPPIPGGLQLEAQMRFTAIDAAGNASEGYILNAIFDTVVSSVSFVQQFATVNSQTTISNAPVITGTYGFEAATSFGATSLEVTVNGVTYVLGTDAALTTSGTAWSLDLSQTAQTLEAGKYDVKAVHADDAGNVESDSTFGELLIRNSNMSFANPTVNHLETGNFKPTLTGLFDSSATNLTVSVDGAVYVLGTDAELTNNGNNWALNLSGSLLADGAYDVSVSQTVGGITTLDTTSNEVIIDAALVGPKVKSQTTADGDTLITGFFHQAQSDSFTVTVDGSTYTLGVDAELTNAGNQWSLDLASTLTPGSYDVVATSTDALGNSASDSTTADLHILETAGVNEAITANFRPVITGEFDDVTTDVLTVEANGISYTLGTDAELTALGGGQWALNLANAPLAKGFHDVTVTATDNDTATTVTNTVNDAIGIFNVVGTPASDTLTGNLGATNGILSKGGFDTITGGNVDDVIAVADNNFLSVDGGKGFDTLILAGDGMNLTSIDFTKLFSIEALDLSVGNSSNTISLSTQDVLDMSSTDSLIIMGESTDTVNLGGDWTASTGTQVIDSVTYDSYSDNGASLLIEQGISVMYS